MVQFYLFYSPSWKNDISFFELREINPKEFNDLLWNIKNPYEFIAFSLLHEIGHSQCEHTNDKSNLNLNIKWNKLLDANERRAWAWAFEYRKKHPKEYNALVAEIPKLYIKFCKKIGRSPTYNINDYDRQIDSVDDIKKALIYRLKSGWVYQ